MVSVTLSVSKDIKHKMEYFSEVNWLGFIRKAIQEKAEELVRKEKMKDGLAKEQDLNQWAIELQHTARKTRIQELKKKCLF